MEDEQALSNAILVAEGLRAEVAQLRAALMDIIEVDHYPDATIARRALGMPVTPRDHLEHRETKP